ncbi:MAG: CubicO group peptidase (beta-lactamase class C family) [Myxococcota bacterium]|jgi:CubicO group peptidase (beta-lactamase class C family)
MMWVWFAMAIAQAPNVDTLDAFLTEQAAAGQFVGAVAVVDGDRVLLDQSYGDVPADPLCRMGSVTKSFTAATVYALQDAGALSVDDRVGQWLPVVQEAVGDGPTLRQLMTHHGGLSEPSFNPWVRPPQWDDLKPLMRAQLHQEAVAGEHEQYSNTGFMLLAATIEAASGLPFEEAVRQHLLDPLKLDDSGISQIDEARVIDGRIATPLGLVRSQAALPRLMPYDGRYPIGGQGALISSPMELALWARGLAEGRVLSQVARDELIRSAPGSDMAAGWVREGDRVWHNGALEPLGIYAYLRWSTTDNVAVALCGSPGVMATSPELRVAVEQALAGETIEPVVVSSGPLGVVAMLSTLGVHWLLGALGLVVPFIGSTKMARIAGMAWGVAVALLFFGLTHVVLGLAASSVVLVTGSVRWWRADNTEFGGLPGLLALGSGGVALLGSFVAVGLLVLFGWLTENIWVLMASNTP